MTSDIRTPKTSTSEPENGSVEIRDKDGKLKQRLSLKDDVLDGDSFTFDEQTLF